MPTAASKRDISCLISYFNNANTSWLDPFKNTFQVELIQDKFRGTINNEHHFIMLQNL